MAHFIVHNWHFLPRMTYFVQDDMNANDDRVAHLRNYEGGFEAWLDKAEAAPFSTTPLCLCYVAFERDMWTLKEYGYYGTMRWFMDTFLGFNVSSSNWTSVRWLSEAQLVVPKYAIRSRPLTVYQVILQLVSGTFDKPPLNDDELAKDTMLVHANLPMLRWAHIFERLWLPIFDPRYSPLKVY